MSETWRNRIVGSGVKPASEFLANSSNWRVHPRFQQQALDDVLERVGWVQNVIESARTGALIDGHARVTLALRRGDDTPVPYVVVDLTEQEEALILATFDPISALAVADKDVLDSLLRQVDTDSEALQKLCADLAKDAGLYLDKPADEAPEAQMDKAAELRERWQTERGQLWVVPSLATPGRSHRLLCGDSTDAGDVARLMGGERAAAVLTDPPYGQNQPGVPEDEPEKLAGIVGGAVRCLPCDNAIVVAFQSPRTFPEWLDAIRAAGHKFERMLWLDKVAQCAYPWRGWILKSEAILVSTVGNGQWQDVHPYMHDVYRLPEVSGELSEGLGWHGSVKPIVVVTDIMRRISPAGAIVYDGFLGSGTTMCAAEQTGRVAYGMEISPAYTAVALQRLADMGLTPECNASG